MVGISKFFLMNGWGQGQVVPPGPAQKTWLEIPKTQLESWLSTGGPLEVWLKVEGSETVPN